MIKAVDKTQTTSLAQQVGQGLINAIRSGTFKAGKRLPGERVLAKQFGTSRGTVIEALNLLERQNYIERLPTKGTFVADDIDHELKMVRILFPFPEPEISLDALSTLEMWGASSESYRGILAEAGLSNGEVVFQHFEETDNKLAIARQMRRLNDFDGAIFLGAQLRPLMKAANAAGKTCVSIVQRALFSHGEPEFCTVVNDLEPAIDQLFKHLGQRNYKRLHILRAPDNPLSETSIENNRMKMDAMIDAARKVGIEASDNFIYQTAEPTAAWIEQLVNKLTLNLENGAELFYCMDTDFVSALYQYAATNNIKIGSGVGVFGLASGITFHNLFPPLTYIQVPHHEMGRKACRMLINEMEHGRQEFFHERIPAELIIKEST
jgi:DNA-binding LacI/PurR family transcriptional regulator/DNA-binding transcriptional regulator YhcF (GntR family)